jgi:hypothetical protein
MLLRNMGWGSGSEIWSLEKTLELWFLTLQLYVTGLQIRTVIDMDPDPVF